MNSSFKNPNYNQWRPHSSPLPMQPPHPPPIPHQFHHQDYHNKYMVNQPPPYYSHHRPPPPPPFQFGYQSNYGNHWYTQQQHKGFEIGSRMGRKNDQKSIFVDLSDSQSTNVKLEEDKVNNDNDVTEIPSNSDVCLSTLHSYAHVKDHTWHLKSDTSVSPMVCMKPEVNVQSNTTYVRRGNSLLRKPSPGFLGAEQILQRHTDSTSSTVVRPFTQSKSSLVCTSKQPKMNRVQNRRKRHTIYKTSTNGYSLKRSNVLGIDGAHLKWSNSTLQNETDVGGKGEETKNSKDCNREEIIVDASQQGFHDTYQPASSLGTYPCSELTLLGTDAEMVELPMDKCVDGVLVGKLTAVPSDLLGSQEASLKDIDVGEALSVTESPSNSDVTLSKSHSYADDKCAESHVQDHVVAQTPPGSSSKTTLTSLSENRENKVYKSMHVANKYHHHHTWHLKSDTSVSPLVCMKPEVNVQSNSNYVRRGNSLLRKPSPGSLGAAQILQRHTSPPSDSTSSTVVRPFTQSKSSLVWTPKQPKTNRVQKWRRRHTIYKRSTNGYSLKRSKVLNIDGSHLKWSNSIEKDSKKPEFLSTGSVWVRNGNQYLVRRPKKRASALANEKVKSSLHSVRLRLAKKKNYYCQFFTRFGKCNKHGVGKCQYIHDPSKIAVCKKFLCGLCTNPDCRLTHKVVAESMPDCYYYLQGLCNNESCPYRHVYVNQNAGICEGFLKGYCLHGNECRKKHTYTCQVFQATGSCTQGRQCKLNHPKNRSKGTKRKPRSDEPWQKKARGRYFGSMLKDLPEPEPMLANELATSSGSVFRWEDEGSDFIRLDLNEKESSREKMDSSTTESVSSDDSERDDYSIAELIRPVGLMQQVDS